MPAFVLDTSGAVPANIRNPLTVWDNLDAFTQGYIEALFFTETEPGSDRTDFDPSGGSALPGDAAFDDLDADTLGGIVNDCAAFQRDAAAYLIRAGSEAQNGHDYWLTRNGHGAGFWDRGYDPEVSHALSEASRKAGSVDVYWGDSGKVFL